MCSINVGLSLCTWYTSLLLYVSASGRLRPCTHKVFDGLYRIENKRSNSVNRCCDRYSKTIELRRFVTNNREIIKFPDISISSIRLVFSFEALSVYVP